MQVDLWLEGERWMAKRRYVWLRRVIDGANGDYCQLRRENGGDVERRVAQ
jgi:hypothetical protein